MRAFTADDKRYLADKLTGENDLFANIRNSLGATIFDAFFQFGGKGKISLGDYGIHLYSGLCTCIKPSSLLVSFPYCPLIEQFLSEFPRCSTLGFECSPDACPPLFFQKEFS
ncbi:MAG TPA: hypothetical protein VF450_15630 [Noviherbaspirillum sp.]